MRTLLLDNEAVAALRESRHPHHREVLAYVEANRPARRSAKDRRTVVPSAVRVEAGWDRTAPTAAFINRLGIADVPLDVPLADAAAALAAEHRVSVADAHLGAVVIACRGQQISVLTSDPDDVRAVAGVVPVNVVVL